MVVLEELGLSYETIYLDLYKQESKHPEFLKLNPNGRIPVLIDHEHGDFIIWYVCHSTRFMFTSQSLSK